MEVGTKFGSKESGANLATYLYRTPPYEGGLVTCGSQNGHLKNMSLNELVNPCVQNLLIIKGSIVKVVFILGGGERG